jgi:hypothetical protein
MWEYDGISDETLRAKDSIAAEGIAISKVMTSLVSFARLKPESEVRKRIVRDWQEYGDWFFATFWRKFQ